MRERKIQTIIFGQILIFPIESLTPLYHLKLVSCHDGLHTVLFIPAERGGHATKTGRDSSRVRLPPSAVPGPPQGSGHAAVVLPAQASQARHRVSSSL